MTQRVIGLTGGIATGKSTVGDLLSARAIPTVDADTIARQVVEPESPVLAALVARYGPQLLQADGSLDRPGLAHIIFHDPVERQWVESQIHPPVRRALITWRERQHEPVVCLIVPLLFEARMTDLATEIWVVSCTPAQQQERLMRRNHLSIEQAQARIESQWPLDQKEQQADVVLRNDHSIEELAVQVERALAQAPTST